MVFYSWFVNTYLSNDLFYIVKMFEKNWGCSEKKQISKTLSCGPIVMPRTSLGPLCYYLKTFLLWNRLFESHHDRILNEIVQMPIDTTIRPQHNWLLIFLFFQNILNSIYTFVWWRIHYLKVIHNRIQHKILQMPKLFFRCPRYYYKIKT